MSAACFRFVEAGVRDARGQSVPAWAQPSQTLNSSTIDMLWSQSTFFSVCTQCVQGVQIEND